MLADFPLKLECNLPFDVKIGFPLVGNGAKSSTPRILSFDDFDEWDDFGVRFK